MKENAKRMANKTFTIAWIRDIRFWFAMIHMIPRILELIEKHHRQEELKLRLHRQDGDNIRANAVLEFQVVCDMFSDAIRRVQQQQNK